MIRTSDDICLLCQIEKSTKTNSHIVPKFITKGIFGNAVQKKAYIFDTSMYDKKPIICQDSAKEDFILCPTCEDYFMVLETYFAEYFHKRILNKSFNTDFNYNKNLGGINYVHCLNVNEIAIKLLFFSIFWRCSITSKVPFSNFKIKEEDTLRLELFRNKVKSIKDILEIDNFNKMVDNKTIIVIKSTDKENQTSNIIYSYVAKNNLYSLISNEYIILLTFNENPITKQLKDLINNTNKSFSAILAGEELWNTLKNVILDDIRDIKCI